MSVSSKLYTIHCLSPVHVGTGQGVGAIELPIIRERSTQWPYIPGSSIKGVYRDHAKSRWRKERIWLEAAFGKAEDRNSEPEKGRTKEADLDKGHAGALVWTDARVLAFPVASHYGTFAYVTCPLALQRLIRDSEASGIRLPELSWSWLDQELAKEEQVITLSDSKVAGSRVPDYPRMVMLDEFEFMQTDANDSLTSWLKDVSILLFQDERSRHIWLERLVLVSDEAFQYLVTMCTEITPRIRISPDTKIVADGQLWKEEYLPAETLLYGIIWCDEPRGASSLLTSLDLLSEFEGSSLLQIGANASVGKGRVTFSYTGGVVS